MKTVCVLLFSIILLINCSAQTNDEIIIKYQAATRGSSITILASSPEISYTSANETKKVNISKNKWNEIILLVSEIELNAIKNMTAPSSKSSTDRALIGSLSITKNGVIYESATFDHGTPPLEIKPLIDKLFELMN